jgi:hypothetical protein
MFAGTRVFDPRDVRGLSLAYGENEFGEFIAPPIRLSAVESDCMDDKNFREFRRQMLNNKGVRI